MMKKYFLAGLVTLLPVAIAIWVFTFTVRFLTKPFMGIVTHLLRQLPPYGIWTSEQSIWILSEALILVSLFLLTLFLGLIARKFFSVTTLGDHILAKIPFVRKVYKTSKEIAKSLFSASEDSFSQVVLFSFPYRGGYCLGLVASNAPESCSSAAGHPMISVFIPTTPNPMTGFLIMIPQSELIFLKMKPEEAIKYVISCAVITPEKQP
jgi:uncharacterized membrane protein